MDSFVMTKDRGEVRIEGSADGIDWLPCNSNGNRGRETRARLVHPTSRDSVNNWFAALGAPQQIPGLEDWSSALQRSRMSAITCNPFPDQPPYYIRASFIVTVSLLWRNIANPARGGSARNLGNICPRYR
jgi:hypothetical protein